MIRWFFACSLSIIFCGIYAQDPQFSQFYNAPLHLNPGFTGITPQQRLIANHRLQWPSLPKVFSTYAVSYEYFSSGLKSGFGLVALTDQAGSNSWRRTNVGFNYSYKVRINDNFVFSPGITFGYGFQSIDRSKLKFGDELATGRIGSVDSYKVDNSQYLDLGTGFVIYNRMIWLGVSAFHLNKPNQSIMGDEDRLNPRYNVHGGMKLPLYSGNRNKQTISYITPGFVYSKQGSFSQFALGVNYHVDPISVGFWYRGLPFGSMIQSESVVEASSQHDALIFSLALLFGGFQVGYSYDFSISELSTTAGGSHEISVIYEFATKPFRMNVQKKYKRVECPSFNSKKGFWN